MTYFAPYIDASGLHVPTYQDIEDYLAAQAKAIFGADLYLGNDSQDFQDIASRAQSIYDTFLSAQLAYNNRTPAMASGTALDGIVAINGLVRKGATASTVTLTLTGSAFAVISNGVVADVSGNLWDLPASVTLSSGGTATVTATCETPGAVSAQAGTVTTIMTPTLGWTSVTNPIAATPGQAVETDADLRGRQAISVQNPSQALTTGILGAVLAVPNVVSAQLYENDTSAPVNLINGVSNPFYYPANSLTLVVDGGDGQAIANAINSRKTPGCYTNGDQTYNVTDLYGSPTTIRFYRPSAVEIDVSFTIKALNGYTTAIRDAAKQAIVDYLNSLTAGQSVILSELWQAALSVDSGKYPTFSLTSLSAALHGGTLDVLDIVMTFQQKAFTVLADISATVV